jgi:hypothetical protein
MAEEAVEGESNLQQRASVALLVKGRCHAESMQIKFAKITKKRYFVCLENGRGGH